MRIILKYCESIIKYNKGFSAGLLLLFLTLTFSVCSLQTVTSSVLASVDKFNSDYNVPDAWFNTKPVLKTAEPCFEAVKNIEAVEAGLVSDVMCVTEKDDVLSLRAFSLAENGFRKFHKYETAKAPDGMPKVWMTNYFAKSNGINVGDILKIKSGKEYKDFFIEAIVSLPEAMLCIRDNISWYGYSDFCYIYMDKAELESILSSGDVSNFWSFRFKEGLSEKERQETFDAINLILKDYDGSGELLETSAMKTEFMDGINRTQSICDVLPGLIYVIGIAFTYLFITQIVANQRKKIGLFKALGYSTGAVLRFFLCFGIVICLFGMILSVPFSAACISFIFGLLKDKYSLPEMVFSMDVPMITGKLLCMPAVAALACLFETRVIAKIQPAEAYGDMMEVSAKPVPKWLARLKMDSILKMQLVSLNRNRKSLWLSALALAGSIVLLFISVAYYVSTDMQEPAVFGENGRYRYDYIVNQQPGTDYQSSALSVSGVTDVEYVTAFKGVIRSDNAEFADVQVNAISDDGDLIIPRDKEANRVYHGDGIVLDDYLARQLGVSEGDTVTVENVKLTVNGIAFEVKNCIQYISFDTAIALGKGEPNQVVIKTDGITKESDVKKELANLPGYISTITLENQHKDLIGQIGLTKTIVYITVACSAFLSLIIVFNMVILSVKRRKKEFAIMNSLGVPLKKLLIISFTENLARCFTGLIIGIPIGIAFPILLFDSFSSITTNFPVVYLKEICVLCVIVSLLYSLAGVWLTIKKIKKVDPAIDLNSGE